MELEETMQLTWLGHAAFYIQASDDSRIVIDPYESVSFGGAISYPAISVEADAVFTTHQHADHAATDSLPGKPELYAEEETATVGSVDVTGFHTFHDTTHGSERGGNTIYVLEDNDLFQHVYGVATSLGSMGCVVESMEAGDVYGSHSGSFFFRVELRLPGQRIRCCVVSMLVCGEHRVSFDGDGRIGYSSAERA